MHWAVVGNRSGANQGMARIVNEKAMIGRNSGSKLVKVENDDGRLRLR